MEKQCGGKVIGGHCEENEKNIYSRGVDQAEESKEFKELGSDSDLPERWQGKAGHS